MRVLPAVVRVKEAVPVRVLPAVVQMIAAAAVAPELGVPDPRVASIVVKRVDEYELGQAMGEPRSMCGPARSDGLDAYWTE